MIRTRYQHNLDLLKEMIIAMGNEAQSAVDESIVALKELDIELADKVIEGDQLIDDMDRTIERCIQQIIARQNPTAGDMRLVTSCMKISIDIERMADMAVDIANVAKRIEGEHIKPLVDIPRMGELVSNMLQNAINAFETVDPDLAKEVSREDDEIDKLFYNTERELIEIMVNDKTTINNASHLLFVLRYLERMGDHACNICESIVYMASGERVDLN
ncbi:phosphate signaling complex protein PhoU [Methanolobus sp. ZRKC3]|uniref:phosphate signaling complex protein PhoU n=1 Tax=Methanolobus sp. ZRKC3 TaxID=3125786 RepID=UPI00325125E7